MYSKCSKEKRNVFDQDVPFLRKIIMKTSYTCIRPTYVREFRCDGKSCKSHCCGDWRITIDEDTIRKYSNMEPKAEGEEILSHIIYRKPLKSFGISLQEDYRCPFLDDDYLCKLQKRYGEDYLSDICVTYPRVFYQVEDLLEESLAITCPVAARQILFSGEQLRFETVEMPFPRKTQVAGWTKKVLRRKDSWRQIQETCIRLLQERRLSLNQRLLYLLSLLEQAERQPEEQLPEWLQSLSEEGFDSLNVPVPVFSPTRHVSYMAGLFSRLYQMDMTEEKMASLQEIYGKNMHQFLPAMMEIYHAPMENWLVNEFFLRFYPFAFDGSLLYNGKLFAASAKLLEFCLLLTAIAHKGSLGEEKFLQVVERISQRLDHSRDGMSFLKDSIPQEDRTESAFDFAEYAVGTTGD